MIGREEEQKGDEDITDKIVTGTIINDLKNRI